MPSLRGRAVIEIAPEAVVGVTGDIAEAADPAMARDTFELSGAAGDVPGAAHRPADEAIGAGDAPGMADLREHECVALGGRERDRAVVEGAGAGFGIEHRAPGQDEDDVAEIRDRSAANPLFPFGPHNR